MRKVARSLHQSDVMNVGHLGAADALVDPAHDIAQDALAVVVDLLLHASEPSSIATPE